MPYALQPMKRLATIFLSSAVLLSSSTADVFAASADLRPATLRINMQNNTPVLHDFTLGPTRFLLTMAPGEERTVQVQLTDREGKPMTYNFSTEDFIADPNREGTPTFFNDNANGPYPARFWITPEFRSVQLNHGERAFIDVTVRVPKSVDPGDHQAALIVTRKTNPNPNPDVGGFNIVSRVASLFVITVEGKCTEEGSISGISSRYGLNWFLPVYLHLSADNATSTVHMQPTGTVQIRNIFGILVDEVPFNDWVVLRNSTRAIDFTWSPRFALGRYTATTHFTAYNDLQSLNDPSCGSKTLAGVSTSFWVIPLLPVLIILLLIFLVSFLVQYFFSRFEIHKKGEDSETTMKKRK
ncbi:MAG TPA: hypothetical protein VHA78_01620 [Candidatus Peribacteraceae bacterium]|nr:hypothetical protein [Candidatus Peribacteraceae bacterium]